jgi:hypothetical protein
LRRTKSLSNLDKMVIDEDECYNQTYKIEDISTEKNDLRSEFYQVLSSLVHEQDKHNKEFSQNHEKLKKSITKENM